LTEGVVGRDDSFGAVAAEYEGGLDVRRIGRWLDRRVVAGLVFAAAVGSLTWVALATDVDMRPARLVVLSGVITVIWLVALRKPMLAPARGVEGSLNAAVGALSGLGAVTVLNFWLLDGRFSGETLLFMGGSVLVIALTFQAVTARVSPPSQRVVFFGASEQSLELVRCLAAEPRSAFRCVGVLGGSSGEVTAQGARALGAKHDALDVIRRERPEVVVCSTPRQRTQLVGRMLDAGVTSVRVVDALEFSELAFGRVASGCMRASWFTSVLDYEPRHHRARAERVFDFTFAAVALVVTAPLLLVIGALVGLTSPGPVLFRQVRSGEGGKLFVMLKFRSMVRDAETIAPVWASRNDPRITPVGRVLRKARLDELPQFWNVLRGDMSVVGPRPERPEYHDLLRQEIPYWSRRYLIKPGITGWAQIHLAYADDISSAASKLAYDLYYLKHRTLALDFVILFRTIGVVLTGSGAR
jgi:exopolysaccharide biosynthesis polyprenyl glycosylphosphotransferase